MLDITLTQQFSDLFSNRIILNEVEERTWNIVLGRHYDLTNEGVENLVGGKKGIIDFLIFPLLARKIIANCFQPSQYIHPIARLVLSCIIAVPLEIARYMIATVLQIALYPVIYIIAYCTELKRALDNNASQTEALSVESAVPTP